jgi:hypothetical protein
MKKTLVVISILAGATGVYAQGTLNWADAQTGYTIEILSPSTGTPNVEQTGQTTYDTPAGTTVYSGGYIGGAASGNGPGIGPTPSSGANGINYQNAGGFEAGLYVDTSLAALTTDVTTGTPVATTTLLGGGNDGLYNGAAPVYTSALPVTTPVYVAIAAWYTANGTLTSYGAAAAPAAGSAAGYVESTSTVALGGPPGTPPDLAGLGLTSFSLATATPEPSTIALGLVGASAFLMRLRRKQ